MRTGLAITAIVLLGACSADPTKSVLVCEPPPISPHSGNPVLSVKFAESLRIRVCEDGQLYSEVPANLSALKRTLRHIGVIEIQALISDRAGAKKLAEEARQLSGQKPADMLSWHRLVLSPEADTAAAVAELSARPEIEYVYVAPACCPPPP